MADEVAGVPQTIVVPEVVPYTPEEFAIAVSRDPKMEFGWNKVKEQMEALSKSNNTVVTLLLGAIKAGGDKLVLTPEHIASVNINTQGVHIGKVDTTLVLTMKDTTIPNGTEDNKPIAQ